MSFVTTPRFTAGQRRSTQGIHQSGFSAAHWSGNFHPVSSHSRLPKTKISLREQQDLEKRLAGQQGAVGAHASKVSGSTWIAGIAALWTISFFPTLRQFQNRDGLLAESLLHPSAGIQKSLRNERHRRGRGGAAERNRTSGDTRHQLRYQDESVGFMHHAPCNETAFSQSSPRLPRTERWRLYQH